MATETEGHAPGPWQMEPWQEAANRHGWSIQPHNTDPESPDTIADVFSIDSIGTANARLIAAAPELLEALSRVLVVAEHYMPNDDSQGPSETHEALHYAWQQIHEARAVLARLEAEA